MFFDNHIFIGSTKNEYNEYDAMSSQKEVDDNYDDMHGKTLWIYIYLLLIDLPNIVLFCL